jgi:hypothetical protein
LEGFVDLALMAHNKTNPNDIIRLEKMKQGNVEVKFLANDKLFPPGLQPAWAVKDGFLVIATTPDAIASFRLREKKGGEPKDSLMMRISAPELAKLLEHRRDHILSSLNEKDAPKNLDNLIGLLGLFDQLTFSQRGEAGQATWTVRLTPARPQ